MMAGYFIPNFWLKKISLSEEKASGLDESAIEIEKIPMIYQPVTKLELTRKN